MRHSGVDIHIEISGVCCIWAALLFLILPVPWILAAFSAAVFHEMSHILAVFLSGGHITRLRIGVDGAVIDISELSEIRQFLCVLAGPVGSLLLLFIGDQLPKLAFCGIIQGVFNLLPVYPLDGGRLCRLVVQKIRSH